MSQTFLTPLGALVIFCLQQVLTELGDINVHILPLRYRRDAFHAQCVIPKWQYFTCQLRRILNKLSFMMLR